jgi:cytochrome c oxidase subunit II
MKLNWKKFAVIPALALLAFPAIAQNQPAAASPDAATPARVIVIHAKKFEFVPPEITLTKDQTVKLELTSDDVLHSLVVPELKIRGIMKKGQMTDVIVTPTQTGDFKGKCGIFCGPGHGKMRFTVHVVN